jgi:hypothetical protein
MKKEYDADKLQEVSVCKDFLHTTPEVIYKRADAEKKFMGLTIIKMLSNKGKKRHQK